MPPRPALHDMIRCLAALQSSGDGRPMPARPELAEMTAKFRGVLMRRLTELHLDATGTVSPEVLHMTVAYLDGFMQHGDGHPTPIEEADLDVAAALRAELVARFGTAHENGQIIAQLLGPGPRQPRRVVLPAPAAAPAPPAQVLRPAGEDDVIELTEGMRVKGTPADGDMRLPGAEAGDRMAGDLMLFGPKRPPEAEAEAAAEGEEDAPAPGAADAVVKGAMGGLRRILQRPPGAHTA